MGIPVPGFPCGPAGKFLKFFGKFFGAEKNVEKNSEEDSLKFFLLLVKSFIK
jgi:hypothetical protein